MRLCIAKRDQLKRKRKEIRRLVGWWLARDRKGVYRALRQLEGMADRGVFGQWKP